jgi:hypothetical protein
VDAAAAPSTDAAAAPSRDVAAAPSPDTGIPPEPKIDAAAIDRRGGDIKADLGMARETNTGAGHPDAKPDSSPRDVAGADTDDPFVNGGRCPNNRPMPTGAPCGPYGISCTYDTTDGTHYCTCLNSGPTGSQGWSCR